MKGIVSRKPRVLARCPVRRDANKVVAEFNAKHPHDEPLPPIPANAPPTVSRRCVRILSRGLP